MKNKYHAKGCYYLDHFFHSKLERDYFLHLEWLKKQLNVEYFLRQVPFHLPGGTKYVVDFMVQFCDVDSGLFGLRYVDVKGIETPTFIMKKKQVEDLYPIKIEVVKRGDF